MFKMHCSENWLVDKAQSSVTEKGSSEFAGKRETSPRLTEVPGQQKACIIILLI